MFLGKRPQVKHHYRGSELALWLDLIPKINKKSGNGIRDSADHVLSNFYNLTSFDDPEGLITDQKFHRLFPINPTTTQKPYQNDVHVTQHPEGRQYHPSSTLKMTFTDESTDKVAAVATTEKSAIAEELARDSLVNSSVPLSITVAIGCSLLFINILIYAGVYYQRQRIKKLKQSEEANAGNPPNQNNDPQEGGDNKATANHVANKNHYNKDEAANLMYSVAIKQSDIPEKYLYTKVPTKSDSPVHRTRVKHPQANSISTSSRGANSLYQSVGVPPDRSPAGSDRLSNKQYNSSGSKSDNPITVV